MVINVRIPAESITNCDTKKFFNRANFYFTITYTYIMITICKSLPYRPDIKKAFSQHSCLWRRCLKFVRGYG